MCAVEKLSGTCSARLLHSFYHYKPSEIFKTILAYRGTVPTHLTYDNYKWAHLVFSCSRGGSYGVENQDALVKAIKEHDLGTLVHTTEQTNPNSGALVIVYIWTIDWDRLTAYYEKIKKPPVFNWKKAS